MKLSQYLKGSPKKKAHNKVDSLLNSVLLKWSSFNTSLLPKIQWKKDYQEINVILIPKLNR